MREFFYHCKYLLSGEDSLVIVYERKAEEFELGRMAGLHKQLCLKRNAYIYIYMIIVLEGFDRPPLPAEPPMFARGTGSQCCLRLKDILKSPQKTFKLI